MSSKPVKGTNKPLNAGPIGSLQPVARAARFQSFRNFVPQPNFIRYYW
jgi:hypothetical protein